MENVKPDKGEPPESSGGSAPLVASRVGVLDVDANRGAENGAGVWGIGGAGGGTTAKDARGVAELTNAAVSNRRASNARARMVESSRKCWYTTVSTSSNSVSRISTLPRPARSDVRLATDAPVEESRLGQ